MKRNLAMAVAAAFAAPMFMAEAAASDTKVKFSKREYDMDTGGVFIEFGNGTKLELECSTLSPEMQKQLMLHGAVQKIGDSYAGAKGNYAEAIASAKDVIEQLTQGVWRAARDEDARPRLAELAEAIARIKNVPLEKATTAVEKATDDQRKGWRSNAEVKATIATLRAEKAAAALEEARKSGAETLQVDLG